MNTDSPMMCYLCLTGECGHGGRQRASTGGEVVPGLLPAVTTQDGTALCLDCAVSGPALRWRRLAALRL